MPNDKLSIIQNLSSGDDVFIHEKPTYVIPRGNQSFVQGFLHTAAGDIPCVSSTLSLKDRLGGVMARLSAFRMDYKIDPGLYALGKPDEHAPVLLSANYKMSFDVVRASLAGRSAWILVLDTQGINVWCAAGKGTFGTAELLRRIEISGLKKVVAHRQLIAPQLSAPGVSAHQVRKYSGFQVLYGPVHARDLPAYLDAGCRATARMRTITFPLKDRAVLIPIEIRGVMKYFFMAAALFLVLSGFSGPDGFWSNVADTGLFAVMALFSAVIGGTVFVPLLLPYLPGRAFSLKGLWIGIVLAAMLIAFRGTNLNTWPGRLEALSWFFIIASITAYLAMNFTGCSTYTSLSGVKKEICWALPLEAAGALVGMMLWIGAIVIF